MTNRHPHGGTSLYRIATATAVAAFATIAFSAPANAVRVPDPQGSGHQTAPSATTPSQASPDSSGADWQQLALGAGGGLALAGVGAAAVAGRRQRSTHSPHPA